MINLRNQGSCAFIFMPHYTYILHSQKLDRFYIGSTSLTPEERLELHLQKHFGSDAFTAAAKDWELFFFIACESVQQAKGIEKHIKKMKSKKYIVNLTKYPELTDKLRAKYQ